MSNYIGIVKEDCFCEHYLHEKMNYDRPWLVEKKLKAGDEVNIEDVFINFYGIFVRVEKDGETYDLKAESLKIKRFDNEQSTQ